MLCAQSLCMALFSLLQLSSLMHFAHLQHTCEPQEPVTSAHPLLARPCAFNARPFLWVRVQRQAWLPIGVAQRTFCTDEPVFQDALFSCSTQTEQSFAFLPSARGQRLRRLWLMSCLRAGRPCIMQGRRFTVPICHAQWQATRDEPHLSRVLRLPRTRAGPGVSPTTGSVSLLM